MNAPGGLVCLDSALFIYFIEKHPGYFAKLWCLFQSINLGERRAVTSTVSLCEVLVLPFRAGRLDLCAQYEDLFFHSSGLEVVAVDEETAIETAQLI